MTSAGYLLTPSIGPGGTFYDAARAGIPTRLTAGTVLSGPLYVNGRLVEGPLYIRHEISGLGQTSSAPVTLTTVVLAAAAAAVGYAIGQSVADAEGAEAAGYRRGFRRAVKMMENEEAERGRRRSKRRR